MFRALRCRHDVGHAFERASVERQEPDATANGEHFLDVVTGEEVTEHGCAAGPEGHWAGDAG